MSAIALIFEATGYSHGARRCGTKGGLTWISAHLCPDADVFSVGYCCSESSFTRIRSVIRSAANVKSTSSVCQGWHCFPRKSSSQE